MMIKWMGAEHTPQFILIAWFDSVRLLPSDEDNPEKKTYLQRKISEYMTRAETIKSHIKEQQSKGEIVDKIHIIANGTNYSYETIFGKYLNEGVKEISLEEPYLREYYQVFSFCLENMISPIIHENL